MTIEEEQDINKYFIGPWTFEKVFQAYQIHNLSDLQSVFDAMEFALRDAINGTKNT